MDKSVLAKVEAFFAQYPTKHFEKGHIVIHAHEEPAGVFYLVRGQVRQYDITVRGSEVVVNVFKPPAFFPMMWAVSRTPNRYFFEAITSVTVRLAPADAVVAFVQANNDVLFDLLSRVYSGVEGMQRRMAHLMGGTARTRVLFELLTECKRFGRLQPDGSWAIALHEEELARRAGLTRETVNRMLVDLKKQQLITIARKQIVVRNSTELEKELGEDL